MSNPNYDPKELGLKVFSETAEDDMSYSFNIFAVWHDPEIRGLFYAEDSGCSCPSPFEDYRKREDLGFTNREEEILVALNEWKEGYSDYSRSKRDISSLRRKIKRYFDKK